MECCTFSVVVPTLNRPAKIRRCLEALAQQDHASFEVIVIDDGSTDDTPATLEQLRDELSSLALTIITNGEQMGANPSRNGEFRLPGGVGWLFWTTTALPTETG